MALKTLGPVNSAVSITIGAKIMNTILDGVQSVEAAPVENETVFSNEAVGGANSIGTPIITYTFTSPMKVGAAGTAPFRPLSLFQNKTLEIVYDTGAEESCSVNFHQAEGNMRAGLTRRVSGVAQATGAVTFTWPEL